MLLTVARLRNHTYNIGDVVLFQKKEVETLEGIKTRFFAYEDGNSAPFGVLEGSRFYTMNQTKPMTQELARTMPDTLHATVVEVGNRYGHVKVQCE